MALSLSGLILAILLCSVSAARAQAASSVLTARAEAYVRATYPNAPRQQIKIDYADLNNDGTPEAIVIIDDMNECGSKGCGIILDLSGDKAESIGTFMTHAIKPLKTSTKGWRDITVSGNKVRFKKDSYD